MPEPSKPDSQRDAEAGVEAFRKKLGPFVVAAEATRMAMIFTNAKAPGDPIVFANDSFLFLTGYTREEVLGKSFDFLMRDLSDAEALARIETELSGGGESTSELHCRRKDGSEFWAAAFISPVRDERGEVVQHFASFVDLTIFIQQQAHSQMLIEELNHRVKNTLATVQSIVRQAFRASNDPETASRAIESRLLALSRSHDLLTQENWQGAGLADLIAAALAPFRTAVGTRIKIDGDNIRMSPKATLALSIAFHELATNAAKYGALSNSAGSVLISWGIEPAASGSRLKILWRESGGPPVAPPSRRGVGSQVLEVGLAHELRGQVHLDYPQSGLVCAIDIPAPGGPSNE